MSSKKKIGKKQRVELDPPREAASSPVTVQGEQAATADEAPAPEPFPDAEPAPSGTPRGFPVVGIGASAGGVTALEAFFSALPADAPTGMAFVVVQHLSPDYKSILTELLGRCTQMRVIEVGDGMVVEPDCAYIIPPNRDMAFVSGQLQLLEPSTPRGLRLPIDFFFRSLAQDQHERAICVVLSGTGSDGSLGARAVKGEGGLVMAQDPDTTEYDGMPRSAIATGLVDYVLPPSRMPAQLMAYVAHAFGKTVRQEAAPVPRFDDALRKICVVLRAQTGHDFSQYKETTVVRRVERRMAIHQIDNAEEYLRFVQRTPAEVDALFRDLLIGVTSFFRDPESFEALQAQVIPRLFASKAPGEDVRIWVCGCSTGEEAYSIAILIQEHLEQIKQTYNLQIFATDVDRSAIEQARAGIFPASIAADVTPERLNHFFSQDEAGAVYRVQRSIRDLIIFSEQDVIKDPPFSRLDMISCRNLLIYMGGNLQKQLISLFHYALNVEGVLFLGSSETVGEATSLFNQVDRKHKIFRRRGAARGTPYLPPGVLVAPLADAVFRRPRRETEEETRANLRSVAEGALLAHFAPAGVLANSRGDILHVYGRTGKFLEPAQGDAALNVISMAREGLRQGIITGLHKIAAHREVVRYTGLKVRTNGDQVMVDLTFLPVDRVPKSGSIPDLFLIIMEEVSAPELAPEAPIADKDSLAADFDGRVSALEQDLQAKEEYLQAALEEMETTNEELKSTNEEMQSINEELQSANEELETSKEELQSLNEELATVNAELQIKVTDLSRANNDMNNLLAGTGVGTLFIDHQLTIARFTPVTTQVINLIPGDIGRPVSHVVSNLVGYDQLGEDVRKVLDTLTPFEAEVQSKAGAWYLMRIRPYRTLENVIEGAVITFFDVTDRKRIEDALRRSEQKFATAFNATPDALLIVGRDDGKIYDANESWPRLFGLRREETIGRNIREVGVFEGEDGWDRILSHMDDRQAVRNMDVELRLHEGGKRKARVSIERVEYLEQQACLLTVIHEVGSDGD